MKSKLPNSSVTAIDISKKALEVAKENAQKHQVSIEFQQIDFLLFEKEKFQTFDIIVSNPPYIRQEDFTDTQVKLHEPHLALFVTENPLIFYERIIDFSKLYLKPEGLIFVEINQYLAEETKQLFETFFEDVTLKKDISGNPRMIKATKPKKPLNGVAFLIHQEKK